MAVYLLSRSVDDVDLYAGGISERHVTGGMVGPTFSCIIGTQHRNFRYGDRFWFETPDKRLGFTPGKRDQLTESNFSHFTYWHFTFYNLLSLIAFYKTNLYYYIYLYRYGKEGDFSNQTFT